MRETRTFDEVKNTGEVFQDLYDAVHGHGPAYRKATIEPRRLVLTKDHPLDKDKIVVNFISPQSASDLAELIAGLPMFLPYKAKLRELIGQYPNRLVVRKDATTITIKPSTTLSR